MKERPILFSPPMVRAILDGKKTQTRRVAKYQALPGILSSDLVLPLCPYGGVGDVLWVRENWSCAEKKFEAGASVRFKADGIEEPLGGRWRPSIHMPRSICRLRLEITEVRIQLLKDITLYDAIAEGCRHRDTRYTAFTPKEEFWHLWISINGAQSWIDNPWVWAITFKRIKQ